MSQKDTIKQVLRRIRPYRFYVLASLVLAMVTVVLTLYAPILTGNAIDHIITKGKVEFGPIKEILVRLAVIIVITGVAQWLMNLCNSKITYHVVQDLRNDVFAHLENLPLKFIDGNSYGSIISRIIMDVDQLSDGLLMGFTQLFSGIITIVGTLLFMLSINVKITIVVVVITPVSLFVASFIAKRTYSLFRVQSETRGEMTSLVEELVGNQKVVKAFSYEKDAKERFNEINDRLNRCGVKALFFSALTNPCTRFVNGLVYAGVGIFGAVSAMYGRISVGQLSCFLTYANQYTKPFNEISGVVTELQSAIASARRVFDLLEEPEQIPDAVDAITLQAVDGSVKIEDVSFSYDPKVPLIENFSLDVKPGERIAIVGPTGCGKTTIINLLMRFYDVQTGKIVVSGHDAMHVTRDSLRGSYGMVLQDTWLKPGTIAENIAYGKKDATREEIIEAAKAAHAHGFISRLEHGYDTVISEEGGNISQGQKQLLCIARVMLSLPPMLILDEATSSIDTRTEVRIQKAFQKMMQGRTSFIVAHRLSTIKEADHILVMKAGKILEHGRHEELLAQGGFYAELYNSQFAS